ncbi:hypothetical protein G5714_024672 [Onychostoma macrolepis]|uniref:Uncharacterized protein n=1 Tax=Onychostoma macrolepis TaxID=369639 RepID=A0A7J6BHS2_9TELE|nr:hypothetical protein G5714_024672 [Onychostoma macrolepis]
MNTRAPPKLSNSTRIYFNESTQLAECRNHTVTEYIEQNQAQWKIISIISVLMNGLLIIVLIVSAFGKTERLEKHIHADLQTNVTYQLQDTKLLQAQ